MFLNIRPKSEFERKQKKIEGLQLTSYSVAQIRVAIAKIIPSFNGEKMTKKQLETFLENLQSVRSNDDEYYTNDYCNYVDILSELVDLGMTPRRSPAKEKHNKNVDQSVQKGIN